MKLRIRNETGLGKDTFIEDVETGERVSGGQKVVLYLDKNNLVHAQIDIICPVVDVVVDVTPENINQVLLDKSAPRYAKKYWCRLEHEITAFGGNYKKWIWSPLNGFGRFVASHFKSSMWHQLHVQKKKVAKSIVKCINSSFRVTDFQVEKDESSIDIHLQLHPYVE